MANDAVTRIFLKAQHAHNVGGPNQLPARISDPRLFPLLRYVIEYALTILIVAFIVAFVMHLLALTIMRLIIIPGWPGPALF
jgi:hypothetical protein